jgi:CrcB protein
MIVLVAIAGALGALVRHGVDRVVQRRWSARRPHHVTPSPFPRGIFVVNVTGSFLAGIVTGLALHHGLDPDARRLLATGVLGAYTTFSSHAVDTIVVAERGPRAVAVRYAVGSVVLGLVAAAAGYAFTSV